MHSGFRFRHSVSISLCFSLSLALLAQLEPAALAKNQMPPVAPSINNSRSVVTPEGNEVTVVQPRASEALPPENQPPSKSLQAGASKFGQEPLTGQVGGYGATAPVALNAYMTVTAPGPSRSRTVPAEAFREWLVKTHPQFALNSSKVSEGDIIDVTGHWDDAGKTLAKLGIPCTRISTGDLRKYPLDHAKVLIINCAGFINRDCFQRIRDFVVAGGYLLTTDWAIDNVLQGAFPGYVSYNHKRNRNLEYVAQVTDPDPILFRNTVSSANWKCETGCHLVTVQKPEIVRCIVRSRALAGEDGEGVLALTFPFGRGQVLHMVGHFDNNQGMFRMGDTLPDPAPIIGIALRQAIASNFVVAGLSNVPIPSRKHEIAR